MLLFGINVTEELMADYEIKLTSSKNTYYPREDSYLLADAVEKYAFGKVLDMGTGTGILGLTAAKKGCDVTFADISKEALECAKKNCIANNVKGKFVNTYLFNSIKGKFNTIIFNPPYLHSKRIKDLNLDGGRNGRELIDKFILEYKNHIMKDHIVLMLESSLNNYKKDIKNLNAELVSNQKFFFEEIVVLMFK